jgi:hypothetical protein
VHSFMSNTMYSTGKGPGRSNAFIPITNGMNDDQLFQAGYRRPKNFDKKAGELSVDYGQIPFLREPAKKGRRRTKSIVARY